MANEQYAFIDKSRVPSREAWQEAIAETGFEFELDDSLTPFKDSGYRPCKLFGAEAGFEIAYNSASQILDDPDALAQIARGKDFCISFRWGGSMRDCASVMIACYALAKKFGAAISYEGNEPYGSLDA